jgi:Na+-transporting methylmalonyl-CoA/oxaloacetate decarboxylase gamma subunit
MSVNETIIVAAFGITIVFVILESLVYTARQIVKRVREKKKH